MATPELDGISSVGKMLLRLQGNMLLQYHDRPALVGCGSVDLCPAAFWPVPVECAFWKPDKRGIGPHQHIIQVGQCTEAVEGM